MAVDPELLLAVMNSDVQLLIKTLTRGVDVNILINNRMTLLGQAIQIGNEEVIQILIDAKDLLPCEGACKDKETSDEDLPSQTLQGDEGSKQPESPPSSPETCARQKITDNPNKHGCDINLPDIYWRRPVHYAVETGNIVVLQKLLNAGVIVNVCDNSNMSPLHLAVCRNDDPMLELLLKAGCYVNSSTSEKFTALHLASWYGYMTIIHILLRYKGDVNSTDIVGRTPLFFAAMQSHYDIVRLLLSSGATVNIPDIYGSTPLCEAVWSKNVELTEILLNAGAKDILDRNLLHHSIKHKHFQIFELLLKNGALVNCYDDSGDTPLHVAVGNRELLFVRMLLKHGAEPMCRCVTNGKHPLHIAVDVIPDDEVEFFAEVLQVLLDYGAKLDYQINMDGDTVLYQSILYGKFKISKELIRQGCDVNLIHLHSRDVDVMGLAVRQANLRLIKLLLHSGYSLSYDSPAVQYVNEHKKDMNEIYEYLLETRREPMALTSLCRIVIRWKIGENIIHKVQGMNLPTAYKNFLLFNGPEYS